jgi:hypothetical protein
VSKEYVLANSAVVCALLGEWDICLLDRNYKLDGAGYGHNILKCSPGEYPGHALVHG